MKFKIVKDTKTFSIVIESENQVALVTGDKRFWHTAFEAPLSCNKVQEIVDSVNTYSTRNNSDFIARRWTKEDAEELSKIQNSTSYKPNKKYVIY